MKNYRWTFFIIVCVFCIMGCDDRDAIEVTISVHLAEDIIEQNVEPNFKVFSMNEPLDLAGQSSSIVSILCRDIDGDKDSDSMPILDAKTGNYDSAFSGFKVQILNRDGAVTFEKDVAVSSASLRRLICEDNDTQLVI